MNSIKTEFKAVEKKAKVLKKAEEFLKLFESLQDDSMFVGMYKEGKKVFLIEDVGDDYESVPLDRFLRRVQDTIDTAEIFKKFLNE
jgi:hypothetical protein